MTRLSAFVFTVLTLCLSISFYVYGVLPVCISVHILGPYVRRGCLINMAVSQHVVLGIKPRLLGRAASALTTEPSPQALLPCFYYGTRTADGTQCNVNARLVLCHQVTAPAPSCF